MQRAIDILKKAVADVENGIPIRPEEVGGKIRPRQTIILADWYTEAKSYLDSVELVEVPKG